MEEASQVAEPSTEDWCGFKFVGDNIDKNVKPSFQRAEQKGLSLHYFHGYAIKDCVNFSHLSDVSPPYCTPDANTLLPSIEDIPSLKKE